MANKGKKLRPFRQHTHEEVAAALIAGRGIMSEAAKLLGCDRSTISNHIQASPLCKQAQEEATELMLDLAEDKIYNAIQKDRSWAIAFYLARKGRKRQYGEKVDITSGDKPLQAAGQGELDALLGKLGAAGLKKLLEELEKGK